MKAVRGMRVTKWTGELLSVNCEFEWPALADDFQAFMQGQRPERPLLCFLGVPSSALWRLT